jgi:CRISPR-associated endoribonuclease Cas6
MFLGGKMRLVIELQPASDRNQLSDTIQFVIPKLIKFVISRSSNSNASLYKDKKISEFLNFNLKISPKPNIYNNTIIIGENYKLNLTISSYSKEVIDILSDSFDNLSYVLVLNHKFKINNVELLDELNITDGKIKIRPMSPILSGEVTEERKFPFYYKWNDSNFLKSIVNQVKEDYNTLLGIDASELELKIEFDKGYLKHHSNITQLVKVHNTTQKAIWSPMYISGDSNLIQFALDRGLGLAREIGYGMIESYTPQKKKKLESKKKINIDDLPDNFGNLIENNPYPEDEDTRGLYD